MVALRHQLADASGPGSCGAERAVREQSWASFCWLHGGAELGCWATQGGCGVRGVTAGPPRRSERERWASSELGRRGEGGSWTGRQGRRRGRTGPARPTWGNEEGQASCWAEQEEEAGL